MVICYEYNKQTRRNEEVESFSPSDNNWIVKATKEDEVLYFKTMSAYNKWAGTTCPISAHFINNIKAYRGYRLFSNF